MSAVNDQPPAEMMAVKKRRISQPVGRSGHDELEQVKKERGTTNPFDALSRDAAGDWDDFYASEPIAKSKPITAKQIEKMAKRGSLMPRWAHEHGFWQHFGNKMQVNGSKEGICPLI